MAENAHTHKHTITHALQGTGEVFTTPRLVPDAKWEKFADIDHSNFPKNQYHVEDPFMFVGVRVSGVVVIAGRA